MCPPRVPGAYVNVQVAELPEPESEQVDEGAKTPVLLVDRPTVPVGCSVPGARSDKVTVQEVGTPTITFEPQTRLVVVEIAATVTTSQLLVTGLLFPSPL